MLAWRWDPNGFRYTCVCSVVRLTLVSGEIRGHCFSLLWPEICRLTKRASSILIWSGLPLLILHFRWLVSKGRISEAVANFKWLRGCDDNTAQLVVHTLHEEMSKQQQKFHLVELFQCEIFKPFGISLLSMVFQQFTGLFVLLFYTQVNLIRRC